MKEADLQLGERIRHLRIEIRKLKQSNFAELLGVSRGAVGNWELGKGVKRGNLELIAKTFNVPLLWLTTGSGTPFINTKSIDARLNQLPPEESDVLHEHFMAMIDNRLRFLKGKDRSGCKL